MWTPRVRAVCEMTLGAFRDGINAESQGEGHFLPNSLLVPLASSWNKPDAGVPYHLLIRCLLSLRKWETTEVFLLVHVCVCMWVSVAWRSEDHLEPEWVLGIVRRLSGLAASLYPPEPSHWHFDLGQGLTWSRLAWNLLHSQRWPWALDPLASAGTTSAT